MVKLGQISINELLVDLYWQTHYGNRAAIEAYKIVRKYYIKDFEKLKEVLEQPDVYNEYLLDYLQAVTIRLDKLNSKDKNLKVFTLRDYEDYFPSKTDREITGDELLISNPLVLGCNSFNRKLEDYDIASIKHMLSHIDSKGNNALTRLRGISINSAQKIYEAVKFYDAQIERQKREASDEDVNLFWLNFDEKNDALILGSEPIEESFEYIAKNAEEMIWGYLTPQQRQKILEMIKNDNRYESIIYNKLFEAIVNYVTLEEAENGLIKTKAINRFIVR